MGLQKQKKISREKAAKEAAKAEELGLEPQKKIPKVRLECLCLSLPSNLLQCIPGDTESMSGHVNEGPFYREHGPLS